MPEAELDFGEVEKPAQGPHSVHSRVALAQIDKAFQIKVLYIFVFATAGFVILDMVYEWLFHEPIMELLFRVSTPIFTFLLGLGTRVDKN
jgi:hypothetical protein